MHKKKKLIVILIAVVLLIAVALVYLLVLKPQQDAEKAAIKYYFQPGDFFVTNIDKSNALVKTTIALQLKSGDKIDYLTSNQVAIRDCIVRELRSRNEDALRSAGVLDELSAAITYRINQFLGEEEVICVYFNDYVLQ